MGGRHDGTVVFRRHGSNSTLGLLTVPTHLGRHIPAGTRFEPVLTDEGILFRFVRDDYEPGLNDVPAWVREAEGG